MILRKSYAPLLLLILPALAGAVPTADRDATSSDLTARDSDTQDVVASSSTLKPDKGTKDAPVDGLDGKPHAGPFVDSYGNKKKPPALVEDIGNEAAAKASKSKSSSSSSDSSSGLVPEDGVMNDPNRATPKKGTTGTEGGVSEKEKNRKEQESSTGEKLEKKPEKPKEARPLSNSDETSTSKEKAEDSSKEKSKLKEDEKPKGAAGLEAC